ncbi:MAG: hypothetical protein AAF724_10375 [Pseudomonadota bacterium]
MINKTLDQIYRMYLRHELWAIRLSMKARIFAVFIIGTLPFAWFFLPGLLLSLPLFLLIFYAGLIGQVVGFVIGIIVVVVASIEIFRLYILSVFMMFGERYTAETRTVELEQKLGL